MKKPLRYLGVEGPLAFRRVRRSDLTAVYLGWLNDPGTNRFLARRRWTMPRLTSYFERIGRKRSSYFLALCERASGLHIGNAALTDVRAGEAVFGILIGERRYRGKGWGARAAKAVCRWGFRRLKLKKIRLGVYRQNRKAIRAFLRAGFRTAAVEGRGAKAVVRMELSR